MLPAGYNAVKTKFNEKIRKERKGKTECRRLRYSWEDWKEKDLETPVCPVIRICVYFYKVKGSCVPGSVLTQL